MNPLELIEQDVFGNSLLVWATGIGLFLVVWVALLLIRRVLRKRLRMLAKRKDAMISQIASQVVGSTRSWFLMLAALFVGSRIWSLPESIDLQIGRAIMIVTLLQAGFWIAKAFVTFIDFRREREIEDNPGAVAAMDVLSFVVRVGVWSLVILLMLDNLGINVTTLVAGLGVGGVAVALAAQNILGDLFASLSIVLDKPFVVGDFLILGEHMGTVEKVGIKTTRVRSLSGEQLIFSNNDLLGSRIRNYGRMFERRVVFSVGVTYQTTPEQLRSAQKILREAVESQEKVRFDRAHFQSFGDFALVFEVVYYVLSPDYNVYMDIHQAINLAIFERFAEQSIEFAYPTQTLYLSRAAS